MECNRETEDVKMGGRFANGGKLLSSPAFINSIELPSNLSMICVCF